MAERRIQGVRLTREGLSDNFVEKRLLRLVALVVGHVPPVRDRGGTL